MTTNLIYEELKKNIIKSYTSGDLDNSVDQISMSLDALDRLYDAKRFQDLRYIKNEKKKLLIEIQEIVDQEVFRSMYKG